MYSLRHMVLHHAKVKLMEVLKNDLKRVFFESLPPLGDAMPIRDRGARANFANLVSLLWGTQTSLVFIRLPHTSLRLLMNWQMAVAEDQEHAQNYMYILSSSLNIPIVEPCDRWASGSPLEPILCSRIEDG